MKILLVLISTLFSLQSYASESSVYDFSWLDQDKEIYVLQNRKFRKKNSFYVGGSLGRAVNGAYIDSNDINLLAGFYFSEQFGLEVSYTKAQGSTNKTFKSVEGQSATPFFRKIDTSMDALFLWSPFYSKTNLFNKIIYYDWQFGLGLTSLTTLDNRNDFTTVDESGDTKESTIGVSWLSGIRFYINEAWSARLDFRGRHVSVDDITQDFGDSSTKSKAGYSHYYTFNLGLNYAF